MANMELRIDYDKSLSWQELKEIIDIIDDEIKYKIKHEIFTYYMRRYFSDTFIHDLDDASFIEIQNIRSGSIILVLAIGTIIAFPLAALGSGLKESMLPRTLREMGLHLGNLTSIPIDRINERLETWSESSSRFRDRKVRAIISPKTDKGSEES